MSPLGVQFPNALRYSRLNYGDILHITLPSIYYNTNFCVEVEDIYVWPLYNLESYYGVTREVSEALSPIPIFVNTMRSK